MMDAFRSYQVWLFALVYFFIIIGLYGISFWLPQIIENTITKDKFAIGLYAAIPWSSAARRSMFFCCSSLPLILKTPDGGG